MRHPVTDIALLSYIARKNANVISYTEATKACKSSSSASRALHQLIGEGLIEPKPKLLGLRYVTQYVVTTRGKQVADLALQLTQLREVAASAKESSKQNEAAEVNTSELVERAVQGDRGELKKERPQKKGKSRKSLP